jgi:hypothetical protein
VSVRTGQFRPHFDGTATGGIAEMMAGLLLRDHAESRRDRWTGFKKMVRGMMRTVFRRSS